MHKKLIEFDIDNDDISEFCDFYVEHDSEGKFFLKVYTLSQMKRKLKI